MRDRVPIASNLVWANVCRPIVPLVYLDLNHFIYLARAQSEAGSNAAYRRLWEAALAAATERRALFPLSGEHLFEMYGIKDPKQRRCLADVMERLSGYMYLLGRIQIGELEVEAGIEAVVAERTVLPPVPLVRPNFAWSHGAPGGLSLTDAQGRDASESVRAQIGPEEFEALMRRANYLAERMMLEGPADEDLERLAELGYAPEAARKEREGRLNFEIDLVKKLTAEPRWRKSRLRDLVAAREITHDWLGAVNRVQEHRAKSGRAIFDPSSEQMTQMLAALPQIQVAISIKTAYHRDPNHRWTANDITDIDAIAVAHAYCDAVFTDKAIRSALKASRDLRLIPTFLPRTALELADWLDGLPAHPDPEFLIPASRRLPSVDEDLRPRTVA